MDQPGVRLARATGRRLFHGGYLAPQRFTTLPSATNETYQIQGARVAMNSRRSIGRTRGRIEEALADG